MRFVSFLLFLSVPAFSGDLLTFKKLEKESGFFRVYLEPTRLKVDISENGKDVKNTLLYEKAKQEATLVDHPKEQYTVLNKEQLEKLSAAAAKMKDAMAKLPPEMQKMIREKMGAAAADSKVEPVVVKKAGSDKVGKWSATRYEVSRGKKVVNDTWTVPFSEVGVEKENFEVLKSMAASFAEAGKELAHLFGASAAPEAQLQSIGKLEGFPVKTLQRDTKKGERGLLLESAEKKSLSASEFAVPGSYKQKNIGRM